MPYKSHRDVITPEPDELRVWRYLDFTKFVSLLEEEALFFANLSQFADPLEGFLSKPTVARFRKVPDDLTEDERNERKRIGERNLLVLKSGRALLHVSCWHMSEYESAAMWKLYLKTNEGIAIQSTIGRLNEAFESTEEEVFLGRVNYIDFDADEMPWRNVMHLALNKRKSFEHEKEMRAISFGLSDGGGRLVKVNTSRLMEHVYVAPDSPRWLHDLAGRMLRRYGLDVPVVNSALADTPLY